MIKNKIISKKKIILLVGFIILAIVIYKVVVREPKIDGEVVEVLRGDVVKEIFEVGIVKRGEEIDLSFGNSGEVKFVAVREGSQVRKGKAIASLDNDGLKIRLEKAEKALRAAEINFNKLQIGGSEQDILIAQTIVDNAQNALESTILNLEKVKSTADERIDNIERDSLPLVQTAIMAMRAANNTADAVSDIHFSKFVTEDAREGLKARDRIKWKLNEMEVDMTILNINSGLKEVFNELDIIFNILENPVYYNSSQTERDLIISQKSLINQSSIPITSLIGTLTATKSLGESEILMAETQKESAKGVFEQVSNELLRIKSPAREEDLSLVKIEIEQAKLEVNLLQKMIEDSIIVAPFDGKVVRIDARVGEIVSAGLPIISLIPDTFYQVDVNIYEADIIDVKIGDHTEIEIIAFPEMIFYGKVIFVDYGPRVIDGVVYYRIVTDIKDYPKEMMVGMTADVTIIPEKKEDVLFLPNNAIRKENNEWIVTLLENNESTSEVVVEVGLKGSDRSVQIISGLNIGDRVLIK